MISIHIRLSPHNGEKSMSDYKPNVTLLCVDAAGGHAVGLAAGMAPYCNLTAIWAWPGKHKLEHVYRGAVYGFDQVPDKGDLMIIVSCITYDLFAEFLRKERKQNIRNFLRGYKKTKIIITDGPIMHYPSVYNAKFARYDVYATICKRDFRNGYPTKDYYQPFDLSMYDITKGDRIVIAHSPFKKSKRKEKGTNIILGVIGELQKEYDFDFDLISNLPWSKAIERKARAHIFIDQVDHHGAGLQWPSKDYVWPALGKSGIEAMHLGCLTITAGREYVGQDMPYPPAAWTSKNTLAETLRYYLDNPGERIRLAGEQKLWATTYATHDYMARYVLGDTSIYENWKYPEDIITETGGMYYEKRDNPIKRPSRDIFMHGGWR